MMKTFFLFLLTVSAAIAGPYPPAANISGTDAIAFNDARFIAWASGNLPPEYGSNVDEIWKTPARAYGIAKESDPYDIVCLGNGGRITMTFPHPIRDGDGADFAVFENSFSHYFLEVAFVEVSSDGVHFFRFPNFSLAPGPGVLGPYSLLGDASTYSGLAGKYKGGFGTPFDLSKLPDSPELDKQRVCFVRIVDIIGDGGAMDSAGKPIYDPYPTTGSGGFDLDAIGVIHQNDGSFQVVKSELTGSTFQLEWQSNPGRQYRVETSVTLDASSWLPVTVVPASASTGRTSLAVPVNGGARRFWRVVRLE